MSTEQIHGHEIIELVAKYPEGIATGTLTDIVSGEFGTGVRFFTCSARDLTADGLVDFLQAKGKFVPCDDGFQTSPDLICKH